MSKVLIIYATHFGQTRAIAMAIAERLRERGTDPVVLDARYASHLPAPEGFDAVVIGSRIELGRHATAIVEYLREHRDALERMPTAFFSVSMAMAPPNTTADPSGYMAALFAKVGWRPQRARAFAGGLPYRKYNWFLRFVMKRISKSAGHTTDTSKNHEFTDWPAVRAYADEVAAMLPGHGVAQRML
jgi:menaquinone-dependent protoporphyrinogen oxidase